MNKNPRVIWRLAMLCLLAFFAMTVAAHYAPPAREDLFDGLCGLLLGATLGLMLVAVVIKRRGNAVSR